MDVWENKQCGYKKYRKVIHFSKQKVCCEQRLAKPICFYGNRSVLIERIYKNDIKKNMRL